MKPAQSRPRRTPTPDGLDALDAAGHGRVAAPAPAVAARPARRRPATPPVADRPAPPSAPAPTPAGPAAPQPTRRRPVAEAAAAEADSNARKASAPELDATDELPTIAAAFEPSPIVARSVALRRAPTVGWADRQVIALPQRRWSGLAVPAVAGLAMVVVIGALVTTQAAGETPALQGDAPTTATAPVPSAAATKAAPRPKQAEQQAKKPAYTARSYTGAGVPAVKQQPTAPPATRATPAYEAAVPRPTASRATAMTPSPQPPADTQTQAASQRPQQPPAVQQPAAGTYSFAESVDGGGDEASTLQVKGAGQGLYDETLVTPEDNTTARQAFYADAVRLTTTTSDGQTCTWSPASTYVPTAISKGATWHEDSTCSIPVSEGQGNPDADGSVHRVEDAVVKAGGYVDIGGQSVFVWAIQRTTAISETATTSDGGSASATDNAQSTDLFAPALGLVVQTTEQDSSPTSDGTGATTTYTVTRMLSTQPS